MVGCPQITEIRIFEEHHFPVLTKIDIQGWHSSHISLQNINLQLQSSLKELTLLCANITSTQAFSKLWWLQKLNLEGNFLEEVQNLGNLTQIVELNLNKNKLTDLRGVSDILSLKYLNVTYNNLISIS